MRLKTWREKVFVLAREEKISRAGTKKFWRDFLEKHAHKISELWFVKSIPRSRFILTKYGDTYIFHPYMNQDSAVFSIEKQGAQFGRNSY